MGMYTMHGSFANFYLMPIVDCIVLYMKKFISLSIDLGYIYTYLLLRPPLPSVICFPN